MKLRFYPYTLELRHAFTTATNSRTSTPAMMVEIEHDGVVGYGEAAMPPYLGESQETAAARRWRPESGFGWAHLNFLQVRSQVGRPLRGRRIAHGCETPSRARSARPTPGTRRTAINRDAPVSVCPAGLTMG